MAAIPSDNYIRLMLDGASPAAFDPLFMQAIEAAGPLTRFQCLGGRLLIALDGSEYFCSRKIKCPQCSTRRRSDGGVECFHAFLGATIVARATARCCRCRRSSSPRRTARRSRTASATPPSAGWPGTAPRWRTSGRSISATTCSPASRSPPPSSRAGGNFILTCKPSSHQTITEYLHGATLEEHRQTVCKRGKRTTTIYRWLSGVPLRATADAIPVNWFSIEIRNAAGKRTYYNSFVTDLPVTADTVAELAACGRARWKIENETFNVLKTNGYNLEHNFGHGKQTLASVFLTLNLLAFAFHTAACSPSSPGERPSPPAAPHTASSRTYERSRPMSCSTAGPICSSPSPPPTYGRLDGTQPRPPSTLSGPGAKPENVR